MLIETPRINVNLNKKIKDLGGSWNGTAWVIDDAFTNVVQPFLDKYFPKNGLITLKIRAKEHISVSRGPVTVAGFVVARAFERDSGAKLGTGVALVEGRVGSGGSRVNWTTWIEEGSEIWIKDFPESLAVSEKWEVIK